MGVRKTAAARTERVTGPHADINNRFFFRLFQTANTMHTKATKAVSSLGVTSQQWAVLGALSRPQAGAGMSVNELSEYLQVSRQNLTGLLNRLERGGLIARAPCAIDRRARRVRMTKRGEALWAALDPLIYAFYNAALQGLSVDDRIEFLYYLNRLQKNMSAL